MKKVLAVLMVLVVIFLSLPVSAEGKSESVRIIMSHDIHSYFVKSKTAEDGKIRENGGAARLKTILEQYKDENSVYLDGGDFSMGTLLQAGFTDNAYELRILGELGCDVTTFGNHEFDFGDDSLAKMLRSAIASGDKLPQIVESNMVTDGELSENGKELIGALNEYGAKKYTVLKVGNVRMAVFGLFGIDSLSCAPTTEMEFENYIDAAEKTVKTIKEKENPDLIVCVSHGGTAGDGKTGEDIDLAKKVPDIDVILSGHTHTVYDEPVKVGKTLIASCGEYLKYVGVMDISVRDGEVTLTEYKNVPCDETVKENEEIAEKVNGYKQHINETYLKDEKCGFDDVISHSDFDFMTLGEMSETHGEYPFGNLIADSYIYEAKRNGIDDIDVAMVGLGTVRGSFTKGDITTADAFEKCSLGVGADKSAGHPIVAAYITGKELKLMCELDASLGPMVSYIKMSYSGLSFTFNTKRALLDRVTEVHLVRPDGTAEEIDDEKLYKVSCNMYAANMLGMLNGLTYGILKIVPKYADGTEITDMYDVSLKTEDGREIKEWTAFKNYLMSFPEKDGVPNIPDEYRDTSGRKIKVAEGGLAIVKNPGAVTIAVISVPVIAALIILLIIFAARGRKKKKKLSETV